MAERTSIGNGRSFSCQALLHLGMSIEFPGGYGLLALGAALVILMLLALTQQMVIEICDLDCLVTLLAEVDHWAGGVKMFVSEIVVLKSFIELFAVITIVFWILGLFLSLSFRFSIFLL